MSTQYRALSRGDHIGPSPNSARDLATHCTSRPVDSAGACGGSIRSNAGDDAIAVYVAGIDAQRRELVGRHQAFQRVAQRFAPLRERTADDFGKQGFIARLMRRRIQRNQPHHGRLDFRRGIKGFGGHVDQHFHIEAVLQHHRQPAEFRIAGRSDHAFDHFTLQHHMDVADVAGKRSKSEQQRRRDVVGQVANDAQIVPQHRKIEFQHIAFVNDQPFRRIQPAQPGDQIAIDLDHLREWVGRKRTLGAGLYSLHRLDPHLRQDRLVLRLLVVSRDPPARARSHGKRRACSNQDQF